MDHDTSESKQKRKKDLLSDSEEEELVKKSKTVRSDDDSPKEEAKNTQMTKDVTSSSEPMEENQNGKYKEQSTRGVSDSDSAGTDVELTSDDETPQNYQKSRKKRRISIKSERKPINDMQRENSSESEDDRPNSPKSTSSVKKFYRKRRNFIGNKSLGKVSSDSESYKTESDSDNETQKSRKGSGVPHNRSDSKKSSREPSQTPEKCEAKALQEKEVETESSSSEDDSNFQKKTKLSSSDESKPEVKEEMDLSDDNKNIDATKRARKYLNKNSGSSSDEWIDPTRRQRERELRRQKKRGTVVKANVTSTNSKALQKSNDDVTLNSDSEKSSDDNSRTKIKEEVEVPLKSDALQKAKAIKKEEPSSDSGSEASNKPVPVKDKLKKENSHTNRISNSSTSSSSESSDKLATVKDKLLKKEYSETKRSSNSPTSSSSHKKQRDNSTSSSEDEKQKSGKQQKNKLPDEDKRIISLKKYLKTAGIRVHNYSELWKDCRSNKARAQKMLSLLEHNGLKGRPTIEKCKKLRKKIETRKEVEELDLSNVMDCGDGRTRRSRLKTSGSRDLSDYAQQKASEIKGRLKLLADSDSE